MRCRLRTTALAMFVGSAAWQAGCSEAASDPVGSGSPAVPTTTKPAPSAVRLVIVPDSAVIALGSGFSLAAYQIMTDSSRVPVVPAWSSNESVVIINAANGYAVAVGPGHATVLARLGQVTASALVTVPSPTTSALSDALVIDSFSMIEFQYPSEPGRWFYAPQMRARAAANRRASVLTFKFAIPGLGAPPPFGCGASLTDASRDLFGEVYGDWLLEIDDAGHRATGETATATITFIDDAGNAGTRAVSGPIVRGTLPASYTGGQNGGACFHGYGSTG
jgi:hypothetical protein